MNLNQLNLTAAGKALAAKIQAGDGTVPLEITRIMSGAGTSADPLNQTTVMDARLHFMITKNTATGPRAVIESVLTNMGVPNDGVPPLAEGYEIRQIGIFATDPDEGEILYRIAQFDERPVWIPPGIGAGSQQYVYWLHSTITTENAPDVIVQIAPFLTREEFEAAMAGKMDLVSEAAKGNVAVFDGAGQVVDSRNPQYEHIQATPNASTVVPPGTTTTLLSVPAPWNPGIYMASLNLSYHVSAGDSFWLTIGGCASSIASPDTGPFGLIVSESGAQILTVPLFVNPSPPGTVTIDINVSAANAANNVEVHVEWFTAHKIGGIS